jgi:hypothetical protein
MIYVIAERGDMSIIKIGFTATGHIVSQKAAQGRLSGLQVGTWRELMIVAMCNGTKEEEHALHRDFREQWIRGEWFANTGPVSTWLNGLPPTGVCSPIQNKPPLPPACRHCKSTDHQSTRCSLPARAQALQYQVGELTKQNEALRLRVATDALQRQLKDAERKLEQRDEKIERLERRVANNNNARTTLRIKNAVAPKLAVPAQPLTPLSSPLTERQLDILGFIAVGCRAGDPPTMRQIGERFGIASTNGVSDHLKSLTRKGALVKTGNKYLPATDRGNPFDVASRGLLVGRR